MTVAANCRHPFTSKLRLHLRRALNLCLLPRKSCCNVGNLERSMLLKTSARISIHSRHALTQSTSRVSVPFRTLSRATVNGNNGSSPGDASNLSPEELSRLIERLVYEDPDSFITAHAVAREENISANPISLYRAALLSRFRRPTASQLPPQDVVSEALRQVSLIKSPLPASASSSDTTEFLKKIINRSSQIVLLRNRLKSCELVEDVYEFIGTTFQRKEDAELLEGMSEDIVAKLEAVGHDAPAPAMFSLVNILIHRLKTTGFLVHIDFLDLAVRYAVTSGSITAIQKHVREVKARKGYLSAITFTAVANVLAEEQGHETLDFRGRMMMSLSQLLLNDNSTDLEPLLDRSNATAWKAWCTCLGVTHSSDRLLSEWNVWKQSTVRSSYSTRALPKDTSHHLGLYDADFVTLFLQTGSPQRAWQVFRDAGLSFEALDAHTQSALVREADKATVWGDDMRVALEREYLRDIAAVEEVLGVRWIPGEAEGEGHHVFVEEFQEAAELLSENKTDST